MKSFTVFPARAALLASLALVAASPSTRAGTCCDAKAPEKASAAEKSSCCAPAVAAEPAAPAYTSLSLYQLDAKWTDDRGAVRALAELRGRPVIVAMFFGSCEFVCPATVADMLKIQAALPAAQRERAAFVLVSFDPARDSVPALAAYRERMRLNAQWTLLRGEPATVQELAALLGVRYRQDARGQFTHTNLITVLNAEGEVVAQRTGFQSSLTDAVRAVVASTQP